MGRWSLVLGVAVAGLGFGVRPVVAQAGEYTPHGFISTRYDGVTSSNIYIGYTVGPVTPMAALVSNPRSGYREHILGAVRFETINRHLGLTWAVAGAKAIDAWYGQLYVLPSVNYGRLSYDATFELYVPLERAGVHQLGMNPGNLMYKLNDRLSIGGMAVWSSQSNGPYNLGAGPSLRLSIPRGTITLDAPLGVTRWASEGRITFFTSY